MEPGRRLSKSGSASGWVTRGAGSGSGRKQPGGLLAGPMPDHRHATPAIWAKLGPSALRRAFGSTFPEPVNFPNGREEQEMEPDAGPPTRLAQRPLEHSLAVYLFTLLEEKGLSIGLYHVDGRGGGSRAIHSHYRTLVTHEQLNFR